MESFAKFGSELDASTKEILEHGARLTQLLIQKQYAPMHVSEQIVSLYAAKHGYLKNVAVDQVCRYEEELLSFVHRQHPEILEAINTKKEIDEELDGQLKAVLNAFGAQFALLGR